MDDPRPSRRIYAVLRNRIGDGTYPAGAHLNIGLLADEFDVTRTTVGKALRLLEADGLIELYTGVGWYVKGGQA
jgi:GntR family transcriptional regulator